MPRFLVTRSIYGVLTLLVVFCLAYIFLSDRKEALKSDSPNTAIALSPSDAVDSPGDVDLSNLVVVVLPTHSRGAANMELAESP